MFDRIALINLDKRTDRLGAFRAKISPYPLLHDYIRYRAVHGDTVTVPGFFISGGGAWGCRQSHLRILEDAMLDGVETLLVFEDDVRFTANFEMKLKKFMSEIPEDWEGLMIGGQNHGPPPTPTGIPGIVRSVNTQRTHAYAVRSKPAMQDLYRLWARCDRHIDHWFGQWQQRHQVYQPDPFLCGQDATVSDISGRTDSIRFWGALPDVKDYPITLLVADRSVAEVLRNYGFHFGNNRDRLTGRDNGLIALEALGFPTEALNEWAKVIIQEALEREDVPGIWHTPTPDAKLLEAKIGRKVETVEAKTVEEAVKKIPQLIPSWRASKIVWCWCGDGHEMLEGLAYHGWHRGYWKDEVTGLDQGMRQAIETDKYQILKQIVRQLDREISTIRHGKILLAHPKLDIDRVKSELKGIEVYELTGETINDLIHSSQKILENAMEMYRNIKG